MNNQRNVGMAMMNYESAKRSFPGIVNEVGKTSSGYPYFGSWVVPILPYLERSDVYELWTKLEDSTPFRPQHMVQDASGKLAGFVNIPLLMCPSDPKAASPGTTPNAYRANAGRFGPSSPTDTNEIKDTRDCGVFDLVSPYLTTPPPGVTVPAAQRIKNTATSIDGIRDGAANTLMLSENTRPSDWTAGYSLDWRNNLWGAEVVPSDGKTDTFYKCEAALGFRIPESTTSDEGREFPMNKNIDGRPGGEPRGPSPASYHPGGVIVTFCDGHVRYLEEGIDLNTFLHLMTPNGKKAMEWAKNNSLAYLGDPDVFYGVLDEGN
jgi:prepilin-type processing-associated H-X9-DG protein